MRHRAPRIILAITLLLIVWQWESILAIETSDCSCYSFHKIRKNWEDSNKICQQNNGRLVSMETEEEYQFINQTIQSLDVGNNEWYIGLRRISRTDYWKWISGHDMTIDKWRPTRPSGSGDCVKMIKHYKGRGLFDDVTCNPLYKYMFICEYKRAQKCSNITSAIIEKRCFSKRKQVTTKENTMTPSFSPTTKEIADCSCYSFHHITKGWEDSNKICQDNGGNLVSMETEEEYQFINKTIQSLDVGENEWYIGLRRISTNYWRWNSGHVNKTIDKWMSGEPSRSDRCVKMLKHYKGWGLFDDVRCDIRYMFICEYNEAQKNCSNITSTIIEKRCFSKKKQITTTRENTMTPSFSPSTKETTATATTPTHVTTVQRSSSYSSPPTEKFSSNENEQRTEAFVHTTKPEAVVYNSLSTENGETKDFVKPTLKKGDANSPKSRSTGSGPFPLVIVTVALGAVLAVSVCMLFLVCYWKRRKNRGDNNEKPKSETTSLPRDAIEQSSNNQGPEDGGLTEGVQLFSQNVDESYVSYAVIHNNLTQQNQSPTASNEPAYASIEDEQMMKKSSKNDQIAAIPAATMNVENSGNSVGGKKSNAEAVYASVDKKKRNNIKNEGQEGQPWPTGQQVVYASVDKSNKSKAQAEDVVYAEVGRKDNTDKQQPQQITYAELADFTRDAPQEAVKPAPYQPAEYAVIIGQKQKP